MNLVDSCGWLEYLANGKNADFFSTPIEDVENLIVPTICILEVFKKVLQEKGEDAALQTAALMQQGNVIDLDKITSIRSAKLSYDLNIPMADSIILATAQLQDAIIWTQDSHFEKIDGVRYIKKNS